MSKEDNFKVTLLIMLLGIAVLLACDAWQSAQLRNILQKQFDYQVEMQFCGQESLEYFAPCRLESDTDGNVHWYFNANEGRR